MAGALRFFSVPDQTYCDRFRTRSRRAESIVRPMQVLWAGVCTFLFCSYDMPQSHVGLGKTCAKHQIQAAPYQLLDYTRASEQGQVSGCHILAKELPCIFQDELGGVLSASEVAALQM